MIVTLIAWLTLLLTAAPPALPQEDEAAWRCWEHGNMICGHPGEYLPGTHLLERIAQ